MKYLFFSGLLYFLALTLLAQDTTDSIQIRKSGLKVFFQQNGQDLSDHQLSRVVRSNPDSYHELILGRLFFMYKIPRTTGCIMVLPCLALLRYPILHSAYNPDFYLFILKMGVAGAGLIIVSFPLEFWNKMCTEKAVRIYNKGIRPLTLVEPKISFGLTSNGVGARINF
jgi:hypothetical protein